MSNKHILAVDIGYGNTKAVWGTDKKKEICFRSIAKASSLDQNILSGVSVGSLDRVQIQVNSESYLVGPDAYLAGGSPMLDPDYVKRNEYLALLRGAIYYMFKMNGTFPKRLDCLVLGLPVSSFASKKAILMQIGKQEHTIPVPTALRNIYGNTTTVTADRVIILPQPIGSLRSFSQSSGSDGVINNKDAMNMVVDPGYNTFDWLVARGFQPELERSGSFSGGVAQIIRAVSNAAGMELGVGSIDSVECEKALETRELHANGAKYDFTKFQSVVHEEAKVVVNRFVNGLDMTRRFDNIIMTGGGAKFYAPALRQRLPGHNIQVEPDSIMMNARGFYQIADDMLS